MSAIITSFISLLLRIYTILLGFYDSQRQSHIQIYDRDINIAVISQSMTTDDNDLRVGENGCRFFGPHSKSTSLH